MAIEMNVSETFDAPPEQVFEAVADVERYGEWMPGFVSIEKLTDGDFGVGTEFRETRKVMGREGTEHFEVVGFEPGRRLELHIDGSKGTSGKGVYRFTYDFEREGEGTRMTMHGRIEGLKGVSKLLGKLFAGGMRKAIEKDHAALKAWIERRSAA